MPSIHGVDIAEDDTLTVDVHRHDCYYNHYRSKSLEDHLSDPLRSSMPIIQADEVMDLRASARFLNRLRARMKETPPASSTISGTLHAAHADFQPPLSSYKGHVAGSTYVALSVGQGFDECPEAAHAMSELLDLEIPVIDIECGTGLLHKCIVEYDLI